MEQALSIAKDNTSTSVVLLSAIHVIAPMPTVYVRSQKILEDAKTKLRAEATKLLDECRTIAKAQAGLDIETVIIESTNPAESTVDFVDLDFLYADRISLLPNDCLEPAKCHSLDVIRHLFQITKFH